MNLEVLNKEIDLSKFHNDKIKSIYQKDSQVRKVDDERREDLSNLNFLNLLIKSNDDKSNFKHEFDFSFCNETNNKSDSFASKTFDFLNINNSKNFDISQDLNRSIEIKVNNNYTNKELKENQNCTNLCSNQDNLMSNSSFDKQKCLSFIFGNKMKKLKNISQKENQINENKFEGKIKKLKFFEDNNSNNTMECSFKHNIHSKYYNVKPNSYYNSPIEERLLQKGEEIKKKKFVLNNKTIEKQFKENTFCPNLSLTRETNKELLSKISNLNFHRQKSPTVFDKLYNDYFEIMEKKNNKTKFKNSECIFSPKINHKNNSIKQSLVSESIPINYSFENKLKKITEKLNSNLSQNDLAKYSDSELIGLYLIFSICESEDNINNIFNKFLEKYKNLSQSDYFKDLFSVIIQLKRSKNKVTQETFIQTLISYYLQKSKHKIISPIRKQQLKVM